MGRPLLILAAFAQIHGPPSLDCAGSALLLSVDGNKIWFFLPKVCSVDAEEWLRLTFKFSDRENAVSDSSGGEPRRDHDHDVSE
eukprot:3539863-Rhodomonas_salina.2